MINKLIKECEKQEIELEIFESNSEETYFETFNNKMIRYEISNEKQYNLKALTNKKNVYISTNDISDTKTIINKIKENSKLSDNNEISNFARNIEFRKKEVKNINIDLKKVSKFLLDLNRLKKDYKELSTVNSMFQLSKRSISITNKNTLMSDSNENINIYVEIIIKDKNITETNSINIYSKVFDENEILRQLKDCIEETIKRIDATSTNTVNTNVLISNECTFSILNAFKSMFMASDIRFKTSVLTDKLNTKVFSECLTIVEDPCNENMVVSRLFDNEGTKTYYKEVVKNGVFKTKLYNNEEANLDKCESTGNGYGVRNMYILPGNYSFDELVNKVFDGIIITDIAGLHSGINTITGDFSVQCKGYEVRKGKKTKAIKMFVMSSNIIEILNNIIFIGNDLKFVNSTGGCPSIVVKNIDIAGSEK